jgi:hypothetical protein
LLNAEGTHQRSFFLDAARAKATKAFQIDSRQGHFEIIASSEDYVRASVPIAPPLPLSAGYPAAILRSRPWSYWRFSAIHGRIVPNEIPDRPPLQSTGPIRLAAGRGGNLWAEFHAFEGGLSVFR